MGRKIWNQGFTLYFIFISIIVSLYKLGTTLDLLNQKANQLFDKGGAFTVITVFAFLLGLKICEWLDEKFRIDWG